MAENYMREEAILKVFFVYLRLIVSLRDLENTIFKYLYVSRRLRAEVTNFHDDFDVD